MKTSRAAERGFTLIEIVLVVALIALIAGVGLQLPHLFSQSYARDADVFRLVTLFYRAETLAATGRDNAEWGVKIEGGRGVLFRGTSYDERDATADEFIDLESRSVVGSVSEIVFKRGSGVPSEPATISLQFGNQNASIAVRAYGVIEYTYAQ